MLKNIDKKYIYIGIIILILPLILILFLVMLRGCSSSKSSYSSYEDKMITAAQKYFKKNETLPSTEGELVTISLDDLVASSDLKSPGEVLKDNTCSGSVFVRNNGVSYEKNNGGFYNYTVNLKCDSYETVHLVDKIKEDIVTEKSGLYQVGNSYVFKGAKVNNHVSFFDKDYLIISIDENNILKLVKVSSEKERYNWDDKYNVEKKQIAGVNNYSDSSIIDTMLLKYDKMKDNQKRHLIGYSVCYGNRSALYTNVDNVNECYKKLDNQFVSLLNTYDYASASYDVNCNSFNSPSCRNYNYLYDVLDTTWLMNGNLDNSYEVYYYQQGYIDVSRANNSKKVNLVIYVDGNELYNKGDGSTENPYVIK